MAAEVGDVEHQVGWQVVHGAPDHPAEPGVGQTVLVRGGADRRYPLEPEVPHQLGLQEGCDHAPGCAVDVIGDIEAGLLLDPVEGRSDLGHRLIHSRVGYAHDGDDADGVLVNVSVEVVTIEHLVLE